MTKGQTITRPITVQKVKNNIPTVIEVAGRTYVLRHGDQHGAGKPVETHPLPGLTPAERKALETLQQLIDHNGYAPTMRELMEALCYSSVSYVHGLLTSLERKGYIERKPNAPRALKIVRGGVQCRSIRTRYARRWKHQRRGRGKQSK